MEFNKYNSIENSYREKYIDLLYQHNYGNINYCITEKIHGANFQFITDGKTVSVGSRNQLVDSSFYNCGLVIESISPHIMELKNKHYPHSKYITVYGELYGKGIQSGVYYGDYKGFVAFELRLDNEPTSLSEMREMCELEGIPVVPLLAVTDNLKEALEFNNTFNSVLTNKEDNLSEGIVISPEQPVYLNNGSRVILKSKTPKFSEVRVKRRNPTSPNPFESQAEDYVNENRLNAVLSKFGEPTQKDFDKIIGLMTQDVIAEMLPDDWKKLDEYKLAGKGIQNCVSKYLKTNLLRKL